MHESPFTCTSPLLDISLHRSVTPKLLSGVPDKYVLQNIDGDTWWAGADIKLSTSRENLSSGVCDQVGYKPVCAATEAS